jgi:hypothetical protein
MTHAQQQERRDLKARRRDLDRRGIGGYEMSLIDQELRATPTPADYDYAPVIEEAATNECAIATIPGPRKSWGSKPKPRRPRAMRAGWVRLSPQGANTEWGHFVYTPNGADVSHCGHPTANYPYLLVAGDGRTILAPNGRAFHNLKAAMEAAEKL